MKFLGICFKSGIGKLLVASSLFSINACIHVQRRPIAYKGERVHVVDSGESLSLLSRKYSVPVRVLAQRNAIEKINQLDVGQILIIPKRPSKVTGRSHQSDSIGMFFGGQRFIWPVKGRISSKFGIRNGRPHEGIDISAARGTKVRVALDGRVTFEGVEVWLREDGGVNHGKYSTLLRPLGSDSCLCWPIYQYG